MANLKMIWLSARINFKKIYSNPRFYIILAIIFIYEYYTFTPLKSFAKYIQQGVSPWSFPFFIQNPSLYFIIGGTALLFYGHAPFMDDHAGFLFIRTGRRNWILGQIVYLVLSSFCYTFIYVMGSVLILLPNVVFTMSWGNVLEVLSTDQISQVPNTIFLQFQPIAGVMESYSPAQTMLFAFLLFWLCTLLIASILLFFNLWIGGKSGMLVAGTFISFAYFSVYLGQLSFGKNISFVSPVSWVSLSYLDWNNQGNAPSITFALVNYLLWILLLMWFSVELFIHKDINTIQGGK
ncbi:hypothetical protein ACYSNO_08040 [Enterococcus sp. LJL98]